jgi:hypothetical protein
MLYYKVKPERKNWPVSRHIIAIMFEEREKSRWDSFEATKKYIKIVSNVDIFTYYFNNPNMILGHISYYKSVAHHSNNDGQDSFAETPSKYDDIENIHGADICIFNFHIIENSPITEIVAVDDKYYELPVGSHIEKYNPQRKIYCKLEYTDKSGNITRFKKKYKLVEYLEKYGHKIDDPGLFE